MDGFFLDVWDEGDSTTIVCKGELDIATAGRLREAVAKALDSRPGRLILDGNGLSFLSAAGITALVEAVDRARRHSVDLELSLSKKARRVLDVVGLWWLGIVDDGFAVEEALDDALRRYAEQARRLAI
ncbi:MAG: STAS domain-containing protein [Actinomycetota bacterium]